MIRCLIVDDSPTFRGLLRRLLARAPGVEVVGEAGDGEEALARTLALTPDVITMDVHMPRRNGLDAIAEIMRVRPTPIVVVSAAAGGANEELSFQALKLGAVEVLGKPNALDPNKFESQSEAIRQAVRAVAGLTLVTRYDRGERRPTALPAAPASAPVAPPPTPATADRPRPRIAPTKAVSCLGIAASTGGPPALQKVLSALPAGFPLPVLVVQHIAAGFTEGLVRWLAGQCAVRVRVAQRGDPLEPGTVLFAPDDQHLMVSMGRVRLDPGPPVKNLRPSATVLFTSLAREFGDAAAGLIMTGMGDDGVAGLKLMAERGAFTAAQGKASSVVFGMPEVALRTGAAQVSLELEEIAPALLRLAEKVAPTAAAAPSASRRRKLLLADDMETILAFEQALLADSYELVLARDGQQALDAAREQLPDAILLDHTMPKLTGAQVLAQLRASGATQAIPVIMVSSETEKGIIESWWRNGCQAVVGKPIDRTLLMSTLRRFVPER